MSSRLFQGIIHQMKDAIDRTIGIVDENMVVIACSDLSKIGEALDFHFSPITSPDAFVKGGMTFKGIGQGNHAEYVLFVDGVDPQAAKYASILSVSLANIKFYYDEKYDKSNFIKNVILDNILPGDIYLKARELHFASDVSRAVLLIRASSSNEFSVYDVICKLFPDRQKDFIVNINDTDIALVKEVGADIENEDLEQLAIAISNTLSGEFYTHAVIGIGSSVEGLRDIARSFKEAQVALEVGKVFDNEKTIMRYESLGIARLIYQLPNTLCETFLNEVFKRGSIESLDQETLFTIHKFFENNLNVSETSRKLFVHRNTLVYRLEKIKKITGLDLREFDHAIVFKIALMVKKYLKANPTKY